MLLRARGCRLTTLRVRRSRAATDTDPTRQRGFRFRFRHSPRCVFGLVCLFLILFPLSAMGMRLKPVAETEEDCPQKERTAPQSASTRRNAGRPKRSPPSVLFRPLRGQTLLCGPMSSACHSAVDDRKDRQSAGTSEDLLSRRQGATWMTLDSSPREGRIVHGRNGTERKGNGGVG